MYPVISPPVISSEKILAARRLICDELESLREDYHPELSYEAFIEKIYTRIRGTCLCYKPGVFILV